MIYILITFTALANWAGAQTTFSELPKIEYSRNPYYESEGFYQGYITDFNRDGILIWSYEGQLLVGYGSSEGDLMDPHCFKEKMNFAQSVVDIKKRQELVDEAHKNCLTLNNPWPFSTMDRSIFDHYKKMDSVKVTPVLIYYVRPVISIEHIITETKNFVLGIFRVNPDLKMPTNSYTLTGWASPTVSAERGLVDGRIVKASLDHWLRKSFEVTIQEGPSGNDFRRMSIDDQRMFNFAVHSMLTGRMVRITYARLIGLENQLLSITKDYDTPYRVISLEVRDEMNAPSGGASKP